VIVGNQHRHADTGHLRQNDLGPLPQHGLGRVLLDKPIERAFELADAARRRVRPAFGQRND
jgi:hypothetical protein